VASGNPTGIVFDIQRYSINDGPGIRTLVFLKGCFMRCSWCSNPESQAGTIQVGHSAARCRRCRACISACRFDALRQDEDFIIKVDHERCTLCLECLSACPAGALRAIGKEMTVPEVVDEVSRDNVFYRRSGGGVTLSGGEPLFQFDFLKSLLHELHEGYLHTALETTGAFDWGGIEQLLPDLDLILYDIKTTDNESHRRHTGVENTQVMENLLKLNDTETPVWLRLPIIPTCNDDEANLARIGELAARLTCVKRICLLPYHALGVGKYQQIGLRYQLGELDPPSEERLRAIESRLRKQAPHLEIRITG
jgi:pyruvate formate lyase activating enzyme